jgi:hypothetical protein
MMMFRGSAQNRQDWISLLIGGIGLTSLGLQPELLAAAHALSLAPWMIAWAPVVEIAAMAAACLGLLHAMAGRWRRPVLAAGIAMMVAGNLLSPLIGSAWFLPARALAGLGGGIMTTLAVIAILASPRPVRSSGLFVVLTALPQLTCWALLLGVESRNGVFLLLAGAALVAGAAMIALPRGRGIALPAPGLPGLGALACLLLIALLNLAGNACWTYLGELGHAAAIPDTALKTGLFASIVAQIAASLLLAWRGPAGHLRLWLAAAIALEAMALGWLLQARSLLALEESDILFGFAWQAALPLATGLYLEADQARKGALWILPVSLGSMAAGPVLMEISGTRTGFGLCALALIIAAPLVAIAWRGRSQEYSG